MTGILGGAASSKGRAPVFARAPFAAVVLSLSCAAQPELHGEGRFVEDGVGIQSSEDWHGEVITIEAAGTEDTSVVEIALDPGATRVKAAARFVVVADVEAKDAADRTISEAKQTFTIATTSGTTKVSCGRGESHTTENGSSNGARSGCERLTVFLPGGSVDVPITVSVAVQRGDLLVSGPRAIVGQLDLHTFDGDVEVRASANAGSKIVVLAERGGDVIVELPEDFAADRVELDAEGGAIDTTAFPDLVVGAGRGPAGTGAERISVRSLAQGGEPGSITLKR